MSTYSFPSITPNETHFIYQTNVQRFISPISGAVQTLDRGAERLEFNLSYRNLTGANRAELLGFLTLLNGSQHRFTMRNHAEDQQGTFGGTPLVAGANQQGTILEIDGCSNGITDWIKRGDWFSVNGELKMATLDADSNGSGEATLTFRPRLRTSPADDAAVTISNATGLFMLGDDTVRISNRPSKYGPISEITITAVEDIGA